LGAFLAQSAKNRAFRSKSSDLLMQILRAFRSNPLRSVAAAILLRKIAANPAVFILKPFSKLWGFRTALLL
jgi:hypothetical protein